MYFLNLPCIVVTFTVIATTNGISALHAETLPGALAHAYQSNPDLQAARASLRSTDESVAIARSGYRPSLSIDATAAQIDQDNGGSDQGRVGIQLDQSLFDSFVTKNAVRSAIASVKSGRGSLSASEQDVLLAAATAYLDVRRDADEIGIRSANLDFLSQQVNSAQARFDVGDETNTAIAEAQARQADATAQLARARAQLAASEAAYRQIVGKAPVDLQAAQVPETLLPDGLSEAIRQAEQFHPTNIASRAATEAARYDINRTRGALGPTLGLSGRVERVVDDLDTDDIRSQQGTVGSVALQLRVPIYQAGQVSARVRQARQLVEQLEQLQHAANNAVTAGVQSAWAQLQAARAAQTATQTQIDAATLARDGKLDEQEVGIATTLDVLNAQQDVLAANLAASSAQRDTVVAAYTLLAASGQLQAASLDLPVEFYEPGTHADTVNRQWFGTRPRQ